MKPVANGWPDRTLQAARLIGFSVCFNQLLPSLYLAGLIGKRGDGPAIVFGGSSCAGRIGLSLLRNFPQIDYVIDGEGERPLLGLCAFLGGQSASLPEQVSGRTPIPAVSCPQIEDLNLLPIPDFTPYFARMTALFPALPFIPVLPLEFSRGCWWNRCAFCNLNLQWQGYRYKTAERLHAEVETLARRHQCLDFTFTDNALPQGQADLFFARRGESAEDCRFFAEIRGTTRPEQLEIYSRGGLQTIQVGIESLSTSLLRKMVKGVTAIENIAMMKFSLACGIRLEGNLILEFPGSTLEEVGETLENLDFVLPFRPLATAVFFLGHGSPVHRNPGDYGISDVRPHKKNRALFPPELLGDLEMLAMDYRGGQADQRRLWRPVIGKIAQWRRFHEGRGESSQPALGYRDGGDFLIIRQELADGHPSAASVARPFPGNLSLLRPYQDKGGDPAAVSLTFGSDPRPVFSPNCGKSACCFRRTSRSWPSPSTSHHGRPGKIAQIRPFFYAFPYRRPGSTLSCGQRPSYRVTYYAE